MTDPRIAPARCTAEWPLARNGEREYYRCIFLAEHAGLHSAEGERWGTEQQLDIEVDLRRGPDAN